MTDLTREGLVELAERCLDRTAEAADIALSYGVGERLSTEWIREAANYATVAATLHARAIEAGRSTTGATNAR